MHDGDGHWTYPCNARALKRWQTILNYIVNWPIFELYQNGVRKHGSSPCMFWWDQPMKLDEEAPDGAYDSNSNMDKD